MTAEAAALTAYMEVLPRRAESASHARRLVSSALRQWELTELDENARLVVSELVTNTVLHAVHDLIWVRVNQPRPDRVQILVSDLSMRVPRPRASIGVTDESGRGLRLVEALCDGRWGVQRMSWGKQVWAQLSLAADG
ncbi:hypothetical protein SRB5_53310 [Streptomyces sp. RB5]|uniref:Histidine kinase/HSP90-like ATPase domain-containing protein n=1 Tax=Streptomyces smaragdinus TaxID=2585196 RepID=A0A7K0CPB9_9ACTN|nr:ATP-binding protein [Streptomyces smaragdinus]MQY15153.1 hypothetical protein [Streptomyces smaragdinus]